MNRGVKQWLRGGGCVLALLISASATCAQAPAADGMTALHRAVYRDDLKSTRALVDRGDDVSASNRYGIAPLSTACQNGNETIVRMLLSAGADANTQLRGGETVLMTAARTGKLGPVLALLEHKADVNAQEVGGKRS